MKLIIGLGNPGAQYDNTRHNSGFSVLCAVAQEYGESWQTKTKLSGKIAQLSMNSALVILLKPQTFYNDCGLSARLVKDFYKLDNQNILVIHDDLALPFGTIRTRQKGSDAGNNGLKSLNAHLGDDYARIRIGIDQENRRTSDTDFVLGKFSPAQQKLFPHIHETCQKIIADFDSDIFTPTSYTLQ